MRVGNILIAAPAAIVPYCTSIEPQKEEIKTVIGNATFLANKNENKNSFHDQIIQNTDVVAIPGKINGRTTFLNMAKRP